MLKLDQSTIDTVKGDQNVAVSTVSPTIQYSWNVTGGPSITGSAGTSSQTYTTFATTSTWSSSVTASGIYSIHMNPDPIRFGLYIKFKRDKARLVRLVDSTEPYNTDMELTKIL